MCHDQFLKSFVYMFMGMHMEVQSWCQMSSSCVLNFNFLSRRLSLNPILTIGLEFIHGQWAPRVFFSYLPSSGVTRSHLHAHFFLHGFKGLNSGSHVCTGITLQTESWSQFPWWTLNVFTIMVYFIDFKKP